MQAKYKCLKCEHLWEEKLKGPTQCPKCGHVYVKWLNYEEMEKEWGNCLEAKEEHYWDQINKSYYEKYGTFFCDDLNAEESNNASNG